MAVTERRMPTDRTARTRLSTCCRNDDRENRGHSKGLEKALVYRGCVAVASQPSRARVQRDECFCAALHCEKEGYKIPRFCTFDCVQKLNKSGKDGEELPRVSVLRGEKSFPVMLTTFTCIHKETKEKIKYDDYKKLSDDEKEQYNVYPKMQFSGSSMLRRPICRKRDRSCGKNWSRKIRVRQSRRASITVLPQSIR